MPGKSASISDFSIGKVRSRLPLVTAQHADPLAVQRGQPRGETLSDLEATRGIVEFQLNHGIPRR